MIRHPELIAIAFFAESLCGLFAQNLKDYPPPKPPLVPPLPENADWVVSIQTPKPQIQEAAPPPKPAPGGISQVHTVKTGATACVQTTYSDGTTEECWLTRDMYLAPNSQNTRITLLPLRDAAAVFEKNMSESGTADTSPRSFAGFAGMAWLKQEYFDQVVLYGKRPCYHYVFPEKLDAWVDVGTGLPAAYRDQTTGTTYLYSFSPPPTSPMTLPPRYQEVCDQFEKMEQRRRLLEKSR